MCDDDIEIIIAAARTRPESWACRSPGEACASWSADGHRAGAAAADPARPLDQLPADPPSAANEARIRSERQQWWADRNLKPHD
jgi:hypothetical protein